MTDEEVIEAFVRDRYDCGEISGKASYVCPACSHNRKPIHQRLKVLQVEEKDGKVLFYCVHCEVGGAMKSKQYHQPFPKRKQMHEPIKPLKLPDVLSQGAENWLRDRAIDVELARKAGAVSGTYGELGEVVLFPYRKKGVVYSSKVRAIADKRFSQAGSCKTLWNQDRADPTQDLVIAEGECDVLSIMTAGHLSAVSVPNGAPKNISDGKVNPSEDVKFSYVWEGKSLYDQVRVNGKKIILWTDNDGPGEALAEELARRIGKARCWRVEPLADCKDANDVLMKYGPQKVMDMIAQAQPWPISGVYDAYHYEAQVHSLFASGLVKGAGTGWANVDDIYTVQEGHQVIVTGVPGSGKTTWLNALMVNLALSKGWRFAIQSTEMQPHIHIALLAQLYTQKSFFKPLQRMDKDELDKAIAWVNDHFIFLHSEDSPKIDDTLERLQSAVMRYGIRGFCIDPASYLLKSMGDSDPNSIGRMLEAFSSFAQSHGCASWLVAHPTKMQMTQDGNCQVPTGYSISGGADYYNKPAVGITVHRPSDDRSKTQIVVWKSRFSWIAKEGVAELSFDEDTGRYAEMVQSNFPDHHEPESYGHYDKLTFKPGGSWKL